MKIRIGSTVLDADQMEFWRLDKSYPFTEQMGDLRVQPSEDWRPERPDQRVEVAFHAKQNGVSVKMSLRGRWGDVEPMLTPP